MANNNEYDKFMEEYNRLHECCPKCGSHIYMTTLVGYILDMDKKEDYKNLNKCTCDDCGDIHITHDRVPAKKNYNTILQEEFIKAKEKGTLTDELKTLLIEYVSKFHSYLTEEAKELILLGIFLHWKRYDPDHSSNIKFINYLQVLVSKEEELANGYLVVKERLDKKNQ